MIEIKKDETPFHWERPYYIVEDGVRLPIMFATLQATEQQVRMLQLSPMKKEEIVKVIYSAAIEERESGDLEYPRQRRARRTRP